jgi:hypothetical protein
MASRRVMGRVKTTVEETTIRQQMGLRTSTKARIVVEVDFINAEIPERVGLEGMEEEYRKSAKPKSLEHILRLLWGVLILSSSMLSLVSLVKNLF